MVHVVIKAANGAVDDFRVNCATPQWTVAQLKNYLYRHYPTHPPVPSQKLIYSGQLLQDSQHLEDVLTPHHGDADQVVVHLVAYERSISAPVQLHRLETTVSNSAPETVRGGGGTAEDEEREGEGRREQVDTSNGTRNTSTAEGRQPQSAAAPPLPHHTPNPWLRYRPHPQPIPRFPGDPMLQNIPMFPMGPYPPFYGPHYAAVNQAQMQQWLQAYYGRHGVLGEGVEGDEVGGGDGEDIDLPNLPDQPDNPDIDQDDLPVNAGGGLMLGGPQLQARRDLVDYGYMLLMATVLVSIAYFTSSFGRIILFLAGVTFMFMNQAGWFSLQRRPRNAGDGMDGQDLPDPLLRHQAMNQEQRRETEDRQGPRNQAVEGDEVALGRGEGGREPVEEERAAGEDIPDGAGQATAEPAAPPRPGILTTIFTFVTTLFTSLIPQQQPDLQFN